VFDQAVHRLATGVWRVSVKMHLDRRSEGVNVGRRSTSNVL